MIEKLLPYIGGAMGGIIIAFFAWLTAGRKAGVDESGIVFNQWKLLIDTHKDDMQKLKAEFHQYKLSANEEIQSLRERLNTMDTNFATFRRESDDRIRLLDEENRGLRKEIAKVGKVAHQEVRDLAAQSER